MRVLIAGLGLIGGSIGMALRRRGWTVDYFDPFVELEEAKRAGAADARRSRLEAADVVVIATPVNVAVTLLGPRFGGQDIEDAGFRPERRQMPQGSRPDWMGPGSVVTTVCSVMRPFSRPDVIAGHPLAGSEARTLAAARADLFEGKRWFLDREQPLLMRLILDCGATPDVVSADEHDHSVALTSHLPQLLSTALAAVIKEEHLRFAGTGLRTFLRLAGSDASVWAPVLEANQENIREQAGRVIGEMHEILDGEVEGFSRAKELLDRLQDLQNRGE